MPGPIFFIGDDGSLLEMQEQPYEAEDLLQELLASYPRLLDGDRGRGANSGWLLVKREASIPSEQDGYGRWSVDHLFLDREGIPTLVEVKRSADTRIRREVVGQMLDYAANAVVYWPIEAIQAAFQETCRRENADPETRMAEFLGDTDPNEFWLRTKTNLQAGRVRLVFVSDVIPSELRRIVEFLNEQMDPAEVLAVEVQQFVGGGRRTLVPRVIGTTAESERKKVSGGEPQRQWDETSFFAELARLHADDLGAARAILDWANERPLRVWWGKGKIHGSFYPILDKGDTWYSFVGVWTGGTAQVQLGLLKTRAPFTNRELRREFSRRLAAVPGIAIREEGLEGYPSFPLSVLRDPAGRKLFFEALDWAVDRILENSATTSS